MVPMEERMLVDPDVFPDKEVLSGILGESYDVFEEMLSEITDGNYRLSPEWRYYRDGKSWLCKVVFRKKTIFWLSVWNGYFKTAFYFLPRNVPGVLELGIKDEIKKEFINARPTGTLIPLVINIRDHEQISDLLEVVKYKKSLK